MLEFDNKKLCESCFSETDGEGACPSCGFSAAEFTADPMVLPLGTKLNNKIIIGRVMGKGGFGITYLGYDTRMDRTIAVKEYYPNGIAYRSLSDLQVLVADVKSTEAFDKGAEKFYSEAQMVAQFNGNPNIVSVYDYFRANNTVYLVMEYINGITLKNYVKRHGKISDGQAVYVLDKMAAALSITHSAGVLHRDISPDNIMICVDGKIKLIDFGAARQIMAESSSNLTVVLKPGYTPIEQYTKKGRQGAWTDIYSLGVSVYYAMTEIIIDDPYERIENDTEFTENRHNINSTLWSILKKCTMINSSDRYGSAIELRKALSTVSAPVNAEPLVLSGDDVKSVIEQESGSTVKTSKSSAAASAGSAKATAEPASIERFEDEYDVPPAEEDEGGYDPAVNVYEQKDGNKPATSPFKNKKVLIAVICAAVLAIAVGAFFAVRALLPSDRPVQIQLDSEYAGQWGVGTPIPASRFTAFKGDVKVTLELEPVKASGRWDGFGFDHLLQFTDASGEYLDVWAYNAGANSGHWFRTYDSQTRFVFVVPADVAKSIDTEMRIGVNNVIVKSALLEDYDPSEDSVGPNAFTVDILNSANNYFDWTDSLFIGRETLRKYGGDVKITLYYDLKSNNSSAAFCPEDEHENPVPVYGVNIDPAPRGYGYDLGSAAEIDHITVFLAEEDIEKLGEYGIRFMGRGISFSVAALEKAPEGSISDLTASFDNSAQQSAPVDDIITASLSNSTTSATPAANGNDTPEELGRPDEQSKDDTPRLEEPPQTTGSSATVPQTERSTGNTAAVTTTSASTTTTPPYIPNISSTEKEPEELKRNILRNVSLDNSYPGDWGRGSSIPKNILSSYDGDILVTVRFDMVSTGEGRHFIKPIDQGWEAVAVMTGRSPDDGGSVYEFWGKEDTFTFVLTSKAAKSIGDEGLFFQMYGTIVRSATLQPDSGSKLADKVTVQLDNSYPGDWMSGKQINMAELWNFRVTGDVKVTLDLQYVDSEANIFVDAGESYTFYWRAMNIHDSKDIIQGIQVPNKSWGFPNKYALIVGEGLKQLVIVIPRAVYYSIDSFISFSASNFYIRSATFEMYDPAEFVTGKNAKNIVLSNTVYPGESIESSYIDKATLQSIGGDVKVTLDYDVRRNQTDPNDPDYIDLLLTLRDSDWDTYIISGTNVSRHSSLTPAYPNEYNYTLGQHDGETSRFVFTLSAKEIARMSDEGFHFTSNNMYPLSVLLEPA